MRIRQIIPATGIAAIAALTLAACTSGGGDPLSGGDSATADGAIVVGSADFPESQLLATIYAQALDAAGLETSTQLNIGSREVYLPALLDGSITLLPEYTGATLSYLTEGSSDVTGPEEVAAALEEALPDGISMLTPSAAENRDVLAVTQETAEEYDLTTIEDLVPHASELVLGGPPEWETRREGVVGLKDVYGIEFKEFRSLDVGGPLTIAALQNGQVQAADMYSTLPAMADFVALEDNLGLFPSQNIVPIGATEALSDEASEVLDAISAALTTDDLIAMNARLDAEDSIDDVAADWLADNDLD
ncbi:ABC transporter substrate-binding protein [Microbacterium marinilacus]|uniref:ABC transporter substrate-binding protein n=1 Tax=Microbacterium marinilacus TaxID=415209 RepID=A0ABP7BU80_9MICO|nr:ABC transporter substrate-binding protein [Microbacterium marinilacus]MBY0689114.1 ABC transporter substrate-binding protein [Microbacterium marinilacus]